MASMVVSWDHFVSRTGAAIVLMMLSLLTGCSDSNPVPPIANPITPLISYQLDIPEPSGVCFGKNYETLWIVSDAPDNMIYQTDLQGNILQTLAFTGDDLEGIDYDHMNNVLWLAEEQLQEIVKISTGGQELDRLHVPIQKSAVNGLEGVAMTDPSGFWVVNEKNPVVLARLDSLGNVMHVYDDALAQDYSDVCFDPARNILWIISDESRLLIAWSLESGMIERYSLPFDKGEGVAVHPDSDLVYIVNDAESRLYLFDMSGK